MADANAKAKAAILDEFMRTGDLAALVTAYTNLKASATVAPVKTTASATVKTPVKTTEELNVSYYGV